MRSRKEILARARANVERYGFHVIKVFADEEGPAFAYTVGFAVTYDHPEVVVTGVEHELAHAMLAAVAYEIAHGSKFTAGSHSSEILENIEVTFIDVVPEFFRELRIAQEFDGERFAALQCVWPDRAGRYPWDVRSGMAQQEQQPLFGSPPITSAQR
jgi:hypothetical protein